MTARRVADLVYDTIHAGRLDGATAVGEAASGDRLLVRVGLWLDGGGRVTRARFRSTTCVALLAYAESACALAESGEPPSTLDGRRLRAAVAGVHPSHRDRADLVALALQRAVTPFPSCPGASR